MKEAAQKKIKRIIRMYVKSQNTVTSKKRAFINKLLRLADLQ
jgi:hypothetical protein